MGAGVSMLWNPLHENRIGGGGNHVRLLLGGGYTTRALWGELARYAFLMGTLGTTQDTYHGIDIVGILEINDAEVAFNFPAFLGGESAEAALAGGKWITTLSLKAGLSIPLERQKPDL